MSSFSILIVDDSRVDRETVSLACESLDCAVDVASNGTEALKLYAEKEHTIVLTDYQMQPVTGTLLISQIRKIDPQARCILMSGFPDADLMRYLDSDPRTKYIPKPIRPDNLRERLRVVMNQHRGATECTNGIALTNRMDECVALLGESPDICKVRKRLAELIQRTTPLILEGPYGVGKPEIAELIHRYGPFAESHFVEFDCTGVDETQFQQQIIAEDGSDGAVLQAAKNGTLVLRHIADLTMSCQAILAAAFKRISKQTHIICILDETLDDLMDAARLDDMLYFEISLETLHIPALCERPVDVEAMVRFVASNPERFKLERQLSPIEVDAQVAVLRKTYLEGNVEELVRRVQEMCAVELTA